MYLCRLTLLNVLCAGTAGSPLPGACSGLANILPFCRDPAICLNLLGLHCYISNSVTVQGMAPGLLWSLNTLVQDLNGHCDHDLVQYH